MMTKKMKIVRSTLMPDSFAARVEQAEFNSVFTRQINASAELDRPDPALLIFHLVRDAQLPAYLPLAIEAYYPRYPATLAANPRSEPVFYNACLGIYVWGLNLRFEIKTRRAVSLEDVSNAF